MRREVEGVMGNLMRVVPSGWSLFGKSGSYFALCAMEYAPQPPYGTGRPDLAGAQTLAAAQAALYQAMTGVST